MTKTNKNKIDIEDFVNIKTGEILNLDEEIKKIQSNVEFDLKQKKIKQYVNYKENLGEKIIRKGKYMVFYEKDVTGLNLSVEEEGIYAKIRQKLIEDGSCRIYSVNKTWGEYAKEFKISRNRIKDIFESLMNKNLIYFEGSPKEVLINPNYYGYGNYIKNDKAKKVFNIKTENDFLK